MSVKAAAAPSPALLEKVEQILAGSSEWQFDAFALTEATQVRCCGRQCQSLAQGRVCLANLVLS